jgi:hypothetical protein
LTKPCQKFTLVHPSDLPLARWTWMVQAPLGLHPSAVARFVAWRLQGSGTWLDTSQEHDNESCSLKLERLRVASPLPNRTGTFPCIRLSRHKIHFVLRSNPISQVRQPEAVVFSSVDLTVALPADGHLLSVLDSPDRAGSHDYSP